MQTKKIGSVTGRGNRQAVRVLIYALMVVGLIGLSGCVWVPWGPCWGPGGGPRGGGGVPGPGGGGGPGGGPGPGGGQQMPR